MLRIVMRQLRMIAVRAELNNVPVVGAGDFMGMLVIGRRRPTKGLFRQQFTRARVSGDALQCHVDGETFDFSGTLEVRLEPLALRVIRT